MNIAWCAAMLISKGQFDKPGYLVGATCGIIPLNKTYLTSVIAGLSDKLILYTWSSAHVPSSLQLTHTPHARKHTHTHTAYTHTHRAHPHMQHIA